MLETGNAPIVISHAAVLVENPRSTAPSRAKVAADLWRDLPEDAVSSWRRYARFYRRYCPQKRRVTGPNARNLFIRAAIARWELDIDLPAPMFAPTLPFPYEVGIVALHRRDEEPVPPGIARFTATAPTQVGTLAEILVQDLANINRRPKLDGYRVVGYVRFEANALSVDIPLEDNLYATAYRIVDEVTLQSSPMLEAGIIVVGKVSRKRTRKRKPVAAKARPITPADTERLMIAAFVG